MSEMLESAKTKTDYFIHINLYFFFKRLIDILFSTVLFILLLPLFLFICLRIAKKEGRPIFNREIRVGKNNRTFTMWSFRTMTNGSRVIRQLPPYPFPSSWEKGVPDYFKITRDKNITFTDTGLWLAKYHLSKIPQLINVMRGDMSLVGPSPERPEVADYYNQQQMKRLKVRPGLTGYAQIKGATNDNHGQKIRYDLYYTQNCSYKLDVKIVMESIKRLFKKRNY
ncbi:sugar transferase [Ornithinibacillus californiensis]|uniref:sugar transferase n=1 Tax=Ornithinibacillus californiensis TaxID=161536 RepID=UPI000AF81A1C|nr:sugar transferase [Ornithinibacillus californiensis]